MSERVIGPGEAAEASPDAEFRKVVCWSSDAVARVMDTEALDAPPHYFLAVHNPTRMVKRKGQGRAAIGALITEEQFRAEFLDRRLSHVHAVVLGATGTGKSHLVRWVYTTLPRDGSQHVVLIPRARTNLRRVIETILEGMTGPQFDRYHESLRRASTNLAGANQRNLFLSYLAIAVSHDSEHARDLAEGRLLRERRYLMDNLPGLLRDREIGERLSQDSGIVNHLVTHAVGSPRGRQEVRQEFGIDDWPSDIPPNRLSERSRELYSMLLANPERLAAAIAWINLNLDWAMSRLLEFSGDDLGRLMLDVRRSLAEQGKELVVLIEDFARCQGIDRQLLDAMLVRPGQEDGRICVMRSMIACTSGYYESVMENVRDRTDIVVDLNLPREGPDAVVTTDDLSRFSARYLNAVRLPAAELERWYADCGTAGPGLNDTAQVPNACDRCQYRGACHAAFPAESLDDSQGIGLYPFTSRSLDRMLALTSSGLNRGGVFNPRDLITEVLKHPLLTCEEDFRVATFPPASLLTRFGGGSMTAANQRQLRQMAGSDEYFARYRCLFELWGDPNDLSSLPAGLLESFGLRPLQVEVAPGASVPAGNGQTADIGRDELKPVGPPPPPAIPDNVRAWIDELDEWVNGQRMSQGLSQELRDVVFNALVGAINWDVEMLLRTYYSGQGREFVPASISFRNQVTRASQTAVQLALPVDEDLTAAALIFQALLLYRHYGNWEFEGGRERFVEVAECLQSWSLEVLRQLRRLPTEAAEWDPVPTAVELLALGARMQGFPEPGAEGEAAEVDALFLDWSRLGEEWRQRREDPGRTDRSATWRQLQEAYFRFGADVVRLLESRIACAKGGVGSATVIDGAAVAKALRDIGKVWPFSCEAPASARRIHDPLVQLRRRVEQLLGAAMAEETTLWTEWYKEIRQHVGSETALADVIRALKEASATAALAGVWDGGRRASSGEFDSRLTGYYQLRLDGCLQAVERLGKEDDPLKKLHKLGRGEHPVTMRQSREFVAMSEAFLRGTETRVQVDMEQEEDESGDLERVAKEITEGLEQLRDMMSQLAGGRDDPR